MNAFIKKSITNKNVKNTNMHEQAGLFTFINIINK